MTVYVIFLIMIWAMHIDVGQQLSPAIANRAPASLRARQQFQICEKALNNPENGFQQIFSYQLQRHLLIAY